MKNALERGESIEKAKQTFLSAGYSSQEVEEAAQRVSGAGPLPASIPGLREQGSVKMLPQARYPPKKGAHKVVIIIVVLVSLAVLVGAGLLGLYWNKLF